VAAKRIAPPCQKADDDASASELISANIAALSDWRGETLARIRKLIQDADPEVIEEVKWRKPSNPSGVPVWSHAGLLCTGETYRDKVKLTFAKGASLPDPAGLFNSSLDGNARRAIDIRDGEQIDGTAFKALYSRCSRVEYKRALRSALHSRTAFPQESGWGRSRLNPVTSSPSDPENCHSSA
jgi:hypothetical protein